MAIMKNSYSREREDNRKKYMDDLAARTRLMSCRIDSMRPGIGCFKVVEGIEISEDFFKEEYDAISKAYFSVIEKLDKHYSGNN